MWQVAKLILSDPKDKTLLSLIFANVTADDILIKAELDALVYQHPNSFKVGSAELASKHDAALCPLCNQNMLVAARCDLCVGTWG